MRQRRGGAIPMEVDPAGAVGHHAPVAAPAGGPARDQGPATAGERRPQIRRVERNAGNRFEHRVAPAVLGHAVVARQQQRGVRPLRATKMKAGWPNGAGASRRADAGGARPASRRARSRCPPTDPLTAISVVMVETARQAAVACVTAAAASAAGAPGPAGSFMSGAAHDETTTAARTRTVCSHRARRPSTRLGTTPSDHFFPVFCFAARNFLSISARSIESPSPPSARVHAAIASS